MSQAAEIEVSPEEERFLKRFFRRQAVPWFGLAVVIALAAAWAPRGGSDQALEIRTNAAIAQLRSENQRFREQVVSLGAVLETGAPADTRELDELERRVESAKQNVKMIEARVSAELDRRLDALESRSASAPALPGGATGELPSDAAAWDVSAILERLYALEMRQQEPGGVLADAAGAARIAELERRLRQLETQGPAPPPPAAPAY